MGDNTSPLPIVVLISGSGSNLQAFIDAVANGQLRARICAVLSNRADAYGLERARAAGIPTEVLPNKDFADRDSYDLALRTRIDHYQPALVVLAGFMRILTPDLVRHYEGRMMNIHPSLLPLYRGLHTHARCLEAGDQEHGATVHFVTPELDSGPIIIQARVPTEPDDTPERLATRVQKEEHRIYPLAVQWFAEGRLRLQNGQVLLDSLPIAATHN